MVGFGGLTEEGRGAGRKPDAEVRVLADNYRECALIMKALSDETRLRILVMLAQGELCACKILEEFAITQPTLSYHMRILSDSGLVNGRRDGVWMRYSINEETLRQVAAFFAGLAADAEPGVNGR